MSGIFGFVHLDGRPASRNSLQAMADQMANWGPDGINLIYSGCAAFGHALLVVTHESRFEKTPYCDTKNGILLTAAARLDNRDVLCDAFGVSLAERPSTSDGRLVLQAYRKWGAESCKKLFGDWSFAAWHIKEQRLFLARDHLGNTGLYYYFKPPLLVFASNSETVLAHPEVPRELDELRLAKKLGFDIQGRDWSQTYWKDICCLPSAHNITIAGTNEKIENYWRLEGAPTIHFGSDSEYLEGFLEHFRRAVCVRLNSTRPIGTQLSAGLDSSAVTALAARELQKNSQPFVACTSVPLHPAEKLFPNRLTDEWPLAHKVAEFYDNIEHILIRADDITPLAAIERSLNITHMPQHAAVNMTWIISLFENARRRNLGVMLTGQLGNGGVSWSGGRDYIFNLFARNQWQKGLGALTAWKKHQGCSWFQALKIQLLRPMLYPLWSAYQQLLLSSPQNDFPVSFISEDFIRRLGMEKTIKVRNPFLGHAKQMDPLTERFLTIIRNGTMVGPLWQAFGAFYNMEVRDPTADVRLIEYCMGVPVEQDTFNGGERMLIRRAMAGIVPDAVRWNTLRGKQAADIIFRLIDQRADVDRQIARFGSIPAINKYISVVAIKHIWNTLCSVSSPRTSSVAVQAFLQVMNVGYFLDAISKKTWGTNH